MDILLLFQVEHEPDNLEDDFCMGLISNYGRIARATVGHIPLELSREVYFLAEAGVVLQAKVLSTTHRRSLIQQGGLEIPIVLVCTHDDSVLLGKAEKMFQDKTIPPSYETFLNIHSDSSESSDDADSDYNEANDDYDDHQDLMTKHAMTGTEEDNSCSDHPSKEVVQDDSNTVEEPEGDTVDVVNETPSSHMVFHPINADWQESHKGVFQLSFATTKLIPVDSGAKRIVATTTGPSLRHPTLGDGNCFFRAMSSLVTGEETYHTFIRGQTCTFLQKHSEGMIGITQKSNYLQQSRMFEDGVWATEVEVFACATMLNTNIYVYTQSGKQRQWLKHEPVEKLVTENLPATNRALYLANMFQHFEPVLKLRF